MLISEMTQTAKGILINFMSIVRQYGFVPNGSRVYYLNRSQPPFLTLMFDLYITETDDVLFLEKNINLLDKELMYWLKNKTVEVMRDDKKYTLAHYVTNSGTPRPESFGEDIQTAR